MKKTFIMLFAVLFVLPTAVLAQDVADYGELVECVGGDNTCTLTENVALTSTVTISKNVVLDLAGHNITSSASTAIKLTEGSLTVKDTSSESAGKIEVSGEAFRVGTKGVTTDSKDSVKLTIEEGVDVISTNDSCVVIYAGTLNTAGNLTTKDGGYATVTGSGNDHGTVINITGGSIINLKDVAVYHPQDGEMKISGGTISGVTGVEVRAGSLNITGGKIVGTEEEFIVLPNGNGTTTAGVGVAVAQHTTIKPISVTISGGEIEGYYGFYQSDPQENFGKEGVGEITLSITGGKISAINEGTVAVYSENILGFITGGTFNKEVSATYIKTGYEASEVTGGYSVSKIVPKTDIPVLDTEETPKEAVVGTTDAEETKEVLLESLKENEEFASLSETQSVTVAVDVADVEEDELSEEIKDAIGELVGKDTIAKYFDVSVLVKDTASDRKLGNLTELTDSIKLMILLPEELKNTDKDILRTYYVIRRHMNGNEAEYEKISATLSEDGKYLTFETSKFSVYALAYNDVENPQTFDGLLTNVGMGTVSLIGIVGAVIYLTKKNKVRAN